MPYVRTWSIWYIAEEGDRGCSAEMDIGCFLIKGDASVLFSQFF